MAKYPFLTLWVGAATLLLGGCAGSHNCHANPERDSSFVHLQGALGLSDCHERHLDTMATHINDLRLVAAEEEKKLAASEAVLNDITRRLKEQRKKGAVTAAKADALRDDINAKRRELSALRQKVSSLRRDVDSLKHKKTSAYQKKLERETTAAALRKTQAEIDLLQTHIESDLLIRAKNTLQY